MKELYYLTLPVDKYVEFDDKDLEDINFHGGVVCFRLYISKMIENKYKTDNSKIEVKSIEWKQGRDVLYVHFVQTYFFDANRVHSEVIKFLHDKDFYDFTISIQYQHFLKKTMIYIKVKTDETDKSYLQKLLPKEELLKRLEKIEPDLVAGVDITAIDPKTGIFNHF